MRTSSMNIQDLFLKDYPSFDGVFDCIPDASRNDRVKSVEMETYSHRAHDFCEEEIHQISSQESRSLDPLRSIPKPAVLLELGCGNARFGSQLRREGYTVIESDIALGTVKKVRESADAAHRDQGLYAAIDAEELPFRDQTLDAIFVVATFHHLPNPGRALAEMARALKPGGRIALLREPASWQYRVFGKAYEIIREKLRARNHNPFSHADDETLGFSPQSIRELLSPYFSDITLVPVQYSEKCYLNALALASKFFRKKFSPLPLISRPLQALDAIFSRTPLIKQFPWDWDVHAKKS